MLRRFLLIALLILPAAGAMANKDNSFCRGYIIKALADTPVAGVSRVNLWLGWNATAARTGSDGMLNESEYQQGRERYDSLKSAGNTGQIAEIAGDQCDMGQNKVWIWW